MKLPRNLDADENTMNHRAEGPFEVKMNPLPADGDADGAGIGRMALDKRYRGDLEATGVGQMLALHGDEKGSAGYVAIERISGTLQGRSGSFAAQHFGLMDRGEKALRIDIIPDTGRGELVGIRGRMDIRFEAGGAHFYSIDYTLPDT
jgi:hypothetical protein